MKFQIIFLLMTALSFAWGAPIQKGLPSSTSIHIVEYSYGSEKLPLQFEQEIYSIVSDFCKSGSKKPHIIMIHNPGPKEQFFMLFNCK